MFCDQCIVSTWQAIKSKPTNRNKIMFKTVKCTCCDSILTQPKFLNGLPYGSHCAKKQDSPVEKTAKLVIILEALKISRFGDVVELYNVSEALQYTLDVTVEFSGKKYIVKGCKFVGNAVVIGVDFKSTSIGKNTKLYEAVKNEALKLIDPTTTQSTEQAFKLFIK